MIKIDLRKLLIDLRMPISEMAALIGMKPASLYVAVRRGTLKPTKVKSIEKKMGINLTEYIN